MTPLPERPRLAPKARLQFDRHEGRHVLLYPEKGLFLSATSAAIVELCTGEHRVSDIVDTLAHAHPGTPRARIEGDVVDFLTSLCERGLLQEARVSKPAAPRPYTLVAELTYRCPLRCVYCSNPVHRAGASDELDTRAWCSAIEQAEALGVLQLHLSGGEPLLRDDLESLVARSHEVGLYTNLITSAVPLSQERLAALAEAGLDAVQISIQGTRELDSERVAGGRWLAGKLEAARWVRALGLPLTLNVVLHRENLDQVGALILLAEELGAERLELANTQYLGWALSNRSWLLPTEEQIETARVVANSERERLMGRMEILFVLPDYFAGRPRACMGGWARRYIIVTPDGLVLPCHQATSIPNLTFERVTDRPLSEIWQHSDGLRAFRNVEVLREPCASCERRHVDFGGCRCQAFALTGDAAATDPACELSPHHGAIGDARDRAAHQGLIQPHLRRPPREATRG